MQKNLPNILIIHSDETTTQSIKEILTTTKKYNIRHTNESSYATVHAEIINFAMIYVDITMMSDELKALNIPIILLRDEPYHSDDIVEKAKKIIIDSKQQLAKHDLELITLYDEAFSKQPIRYLDYIATNKCNMYKVYDNYKSMKYFISRLEYLEIYLYKNLFRIVNLYYDDKGMYKQELYDSISADIYDFMEKLANFKIIKTNKVNFRVNTVKQLQGIEESLDEFIEIELKDNAESIFVLNSNIIMEFLNRVSEKIRPESLTNKLSKEEVHLLKIAPTLSIFQDINEIALLKIIKNISLSKYKKDEIIYDHREKAYTIDYILKGSADFYTIHKKYVATLVAKQAFGESIFDRSRSFRGLDVVAKTDVVIISVQIDFTKRSENPEVFFHLYENVIHSMGEKFAIVLDSQT